MSPGKEADAARGEQPPAAITARAAALGILGAVHIAVVQVWTKVHPGIVIPPWITGPYLSWYALLPGPVCWLFLVAVLNAFLKRFAPRRALRPAEFGLIFGMATVAAALAAQDATMQLLPAYVFPCREAQADVTRGIREHLPAWMVPHDPAVIEPYYLGNETFWRADRLGAWAVPLLCWTLYLTALAATMWAWNVLLRRRWLDSDRLTFPNMQLPLTLCQEAGFGGAASGRLFWGGFLAAIIFDSLSPIQQFYPPFPTVPNSIELDGTLAALPAPWCALSPMTVMWPTLYLGICYFIPLDILFSAGAFYVLRKLLEVLGYSLGWRQLNGGDAEFPFARSQAVGAWVVLFLLLIWAERRHLRSVLDAALFSMSPPPDEAEAQEFGSYRVAGRVLLLGTAFLILFSIAGGMTPVIAIAFYAFFWVLQIAMTRLYCQVGPPTLELYFMNPQATLTNLFGSSGMGPSTALHFSLLNWLTRTQSGHPMGHTMAAFHIGRRTGVAPRPFSVWLLFALVLGGVVCLLSYLHFAYRVGEDQFREGGWREVGASSLVSRALEWTYAPKGPQPVEALAVFAGAGAALLLAKMGVASASFPLHPIGFALAMCYGVEYSWPAFLMMALVKFLVLRYGGRRLYEGFIPLFLGLILGGCLTPIAWAWLGHAVFSADVSP